MGWVEVYGRIWFDVVSVGLMGLVLVRWGLFIELGWIWSMGWSYIIICHIILVYIVLYYNQYICSFILIISQETVELRNRYIRQQRRRKEVSFDVQDTWKLGVLTNCVLFHLVRFVWRWSKNTGVQQICWFSVQYSIDHRYGWFLHRNYIISVC